MIDKGQSVSTMLIDGAIAAIYTNRRARQIAKGPRGVNRAALLASGSARYWTTQVKVSCRPLASLPFQISKPANTSVSHQLLEKAWLVPPQRSYRHCRSSPHR